MAKIKVTGLWKRTMKNGQDWFSGPAGNGLEYVIFPNGYQKSENDPAYVLYLSEKERSAQPAAQEPAPPPMEAGDPGPEAEYAPEAPPQATAPTPRGRVIAPKAPPVKIAPKNYAPGRKP